MQNPLAPGAVSYAGRFIGDTLTVELQPSGGGYEGTIDLAGQRYPVRAAVVAGGELRGTFEAGGHPFELVAVLRDDQLMLSSGGASYGLVRERKAAPQNPLARPAPPSVSAPPPASAAGGDGEGELFRHPTGVTLRCPPGWRAQMTQLGVQLLPPDVASTAQGPSEVYLVTGHPAPGIERADDPRVVSFLDQSTVGLLPFLQRTAAPEPGPLAGESSLRLRYDGLNPMTGLDTSSVVLVRIVRGHVLAVVAIGERPRVATRAAALEGTFRSIAWGEGQRDLLLAGVWHHWSWRGGSKVTGETRQQAQLAPDGRIAMTSNTETVGALSERDSGGNLRWSADFVGQGGNSRQGTWTAADGQLFISWSDGTTAAFAYQVGGVPGNRRLTLVPPGGGEKIEWTERPVVV